EVSAQAVGQERKRIVPAPARGYDLREALGPCGVLVAGGADEAADAGSGVRCGALQKERRDGEGEGGDGAECGGVVPGVDGVGVDHFDKMTFRVSSTSPAWRR